MVSKKRKIIIDFEVLSKAGFWMCVMKDYKTGREHTIVNDRDEFLRVFEKNKNSIWVGYNIKGYDQWIMKAILSNLNPCIVSDKLINEKLKGWQIDRRLNIPKLYYFELGNHIRSLKELELFMGESIKESDVDFDLNRYPTNEEIEELKSYCTYDVRMTFKVFEEQYYKYEAQEGLIDYFKLEEEMFNKTEAQLGAYILDAKKPNFERDDAHDFEIINTLKFSKYSYIKDWYLDYNNRINYNNIKANVYGVETDFGWGGLHAARKKYIGEDFIVNSDVSSFYPSIMIGYNLLSRNIKNPEKYREIRDTRFELKRNGDKREQSLKLVLNSTYGACKDINNELYDPMMGDGICVNGQLLLLDLIEKVELEFGDRAVFIQGNTDGVMFKFNSKEDIDRYIEICNEWSSRTKMSLEHDSIKKIIQKDVNNYVFIQENESIKSKGSYLKKLSLLDNDLPIVNKALIEKLINNIEIETTINNEIKLINFQKCIKITGKYSYAKHGSENLKLKVLRGFASNSSIDYPIMKVKDDNKIEKIANTPDKVFIDNGNIIEKSVPDKLDRGWYISLAKKRLDEFIPEYEYTLFDLF
ncbi:MAG: DNA polymerase domain-containing protein [Romboutsia sp.]